MTVSFLLECTPFASAANTEKAESIVLAMAFDATKNHTGQWQI